MIVLHKYSRCEFKYMSTIELKSYYNLDIDGNTKNLIKYIDSKLFSTGCDSISNIRVSIDDDHFCYVDVKYYYGHKQFIKYSTHYYFSYYMYNVIYESGIWYHVLKDSTCMCSEQDLLNYLKKITDFLESRRWYIKITLLPLIKDVIQHIGMLFIDYHQLYNIILI